MALQGTIKDFGLADIFQLIGIQRKTGVLTLENEEETVTVKFLEGQVVGADTRMRNLEDLLGSVLVRTGRVTEAQLQEALRQQQKTLQRLGYILVKSGAISEEELREALRIQVAQIVYRLFRWRDGRYNFDPVDHLEYDEEHAIPVSAETILMEGARMIDEWPIIERRIRSGEMLFRKTPAGASVESPVASLVEADIDLGFGVDSSEDGGGGDDELKLSPDERHVLRLVDGRSTVEEIVDRSPLGEFDTYRSLYELLNRNLVEEVRSVGTIGIAQAAGAASGILERLLVAAVLALAALGLATLPANPLTPWRLSEPRRDADLLRGHASRARLDRIERALEVHYLDRGTIPSELEALSRRRYVAAADLRDPWGRPYDFRTSSGGYRLEGRGPGGVPQGEFVVSHRFSAAERMMLEGSLPPPQTGSTALP